MAAAATAWRAPLVHTDARLQRVCADVEHACASLGSQYESERARATDVLLSVSQSSHIVDDVCYVLAYSPHDVVHFHMLGALIKGLKHVPVEDSQRQVHTLVDVREWLLHAAVERAHACTQAGQAWPAYVCTQYTRAIVLISLRVSGKEASAGDGSVLLALGEHIKALLAADEPRASVGTALASALANELGEGARVDETGTGLHYDEYMWCKALVEVHTLPSIVPLLLQVLQSMSDRGGGSACADAVCLWLGWRCVSLPRIHDDPSVVALAPAQLWTLIHTTAPDTEGVQGAVLRVSAHLAGLLLLPDIPALLGRVARCAPHHRTRSACYEALLHVANYRPWDLTAATAWPAQRASLLHELNGILGTLIPEVSAPTASADLITSLQQVTHIYTQLMHTDSGRCLIQGAVPADALLEALVRVSTTCYHVAFALVPHSHDTDATAASDAAVDEALALWRSLLRAITPTDAELVRPYVCEHVVVPYQAGRLQAAAISAEADADELGDEVVPDAELYNEQLTLYSALARTCLGESLAHLRSLQPRERDVAQMSGAAWEQWHWIALLVGHVVADASVSEVAEVPDAVSAAPESVQAMLLALIHDLFAWQSELASHGPASPAPASPQTLASLLWCTARWIPTYLLCPGATGITVALAGEGGERILHELVTTFRAILQAWHSDADVLTAMARVWDALARSPGAMHVWLRQDAVLALVREMLASLEALPEAAQAPLVCGIVKCVDAMRGESDTSAAPVRETYYALIMQAAQARFEAVQHASPVSTQSALALWHALADAADPSTSGAVHMHLCTQLSTMMVYVDHHAGHADVQLAAMRATHALLRAIAELDDGAAVLESVASHTFALLNVARTQLGDVSQGVDNTQESLLVAYLGLVDELIRTSGQVDADIAAKPNGPYSQSLYAFVHIAPVLMYDVLRVPSIAEALSLMLHTMLVMMRTTLLASTCSAAYVEDDAPPSFDARGHVCVPRGSHPMPLQVVMRSALYVVGTADSLTESAAGGVAQGIEHVAEALPDLELIGVHLGSVQRVMDDVASQLCMLLFLRPMQRAMLTPLLLALRRVTLARSNATRLGGQETFVAALATACSAAQVPGASSDELARIMPTYTAAVEQVVGAALASRAPPTPAAPSPAIAARAHIKAEQTAALAFNRTMRPLVQHVRQTLLLA